jgi:hypothetical protein
MSDVDVADEYGLTAPMDRRDGQFDAMGWAAGGFLIDRSGHDHDANTACTARILLEFYDKIEINRPHYELNI